MVQNETFVAQWERFNEIAYSRLNCFTWWSTDVTKITSGFWMLDLHVNYCCAVAQLRLVAGFLRSRPGFNTRTVCIRFVMKKLVGSCFFFQYLGDFPRPFLFHKCFIIIYRSSSKGWRTMGPMEVAVIVLCGHAASREWTLDPYQPTRLEA